MLIVPRRMWLKVVGHIETMNCEMGRVDKRLEHLERSHMVMQNDLDWVKRLQWIVIAATLGSNALALLKLFGVI